MDLEKPAEAPIGLVLQAISSKLAPRIPGWAALGKVFLNKKAPTYRKVYQKLANYMRKEGEYLRYVAAFGGQTKTGPTPGGTTDDDSDDPIAEDGEDEMDSESKEDEKSAVFNGVDEDSLAPY